MGEDGRLRPMYSDSSSTSHESAEPLLSATPWPIDLGDFWPPYLCSHCWAMKFYYNLRMAQCLYCGHVSLNWGTK